MLATFNLDMHILIKSSVNKKYMLYSKTTEYAIRVLSYIAREKKLIGIQEISHKIKVPAAYVSKICQGLVHAKILDSKRGATGGYFLRADARELKLISIIRAVDDPLHSQLSGCVMGLADCGKDNPCPLHDIWASTKEKMEHVLSTVTLHNLSQNTAFLKTQKKQPKRLSKKMRKVFGQE